jgi:serine/threonine-protein kinase
MIPVAIPQDFNRSKEFQPGDVADGRYRILRRLADGGMGTVFLAEHMLIKRRVAIKLLHADLAGDRDIVHRFLNEALAAGTLGHPHIVESTDMSFTRDRIPYIVFEYLEGCLLIEEIRRLGRLPVRRALLIGRQIASALEAAHSAQIAHLDLKSDNVFLTNRGDAPDHAKLLDFGISRFMASDDDTTGPDVFMGTPEFMAPEQVIQPSLVDCRADIYSFGVVLYEMLTGHCPFASGDSGSVLDRVIYESPPPLGRPVPRALECLLFDGLLVKSPQHRVQSMTEVLAILDALIAAMRPWSVDVVPVFEEPAESSAPHGLPNPPSLRSLPSATSVPIERWFDDEPPRLEAPPWEAEVWP